MGSAYYVLSMEQRSHIISESFKQRCELSTLIVPISQMKILRLGGVKIKDHLVSKWQSWDSNPGQLTQAHAPWHCSKLCHKRGWEQFHPQGGNRRRRVSPSGALRRSGKQTSDIGIGKTRKTPAGEAVCPCVAVRGKAGQVQTLKELRVPETLRLGALDMRWRRNRLYREGTEWEMRRGP